MGSSYFEVIQHVEEYFRVHLPYMVIEIRRQSYCAEKECLYMVSAEKKDGSFAVWTSWNESIKSLNRGHYNLPDMEACAKLMEDYQNGSLYDENSTPVEVLKKLFLENDDHFHESFHELLYIRGFVAGITAQQENRWDKLTDTEINMLLGEAKD